MTNAPSLAKRMFEYFGAHRAPDRDAHELDRAMQRFILCATVAAIWFIGYFSAPSAPPGRSLAIGLVGAVAASSLVYRELLKRAAGRWFAVQYFFLLIDPLICIGVLLHDPKTFAFLNPFLLVIIVRSGMRYGVRTLWLEWCITAAAAVALFPTSEYWRRELELTGSVLLMLALVPAFFSSLVGRIHSARAVEAERARFAAVHELVVARSSFLAKLSHELRSPLQGIVSALDVLAMRHGPGDNGDNELINRIRRSSLLLNTLLRDLLTLAKGEAGRLELRPEPFDPRSLVESVVASANELAIGKGLKLSADLPQMAIFVVADSARIDQVLTNLVINSIRYTTVGQVRVSLRPYALERRSLTFTISDTGPGIPEELLPTLLTPDRTASALDRRGEGSGIGLAIVRTLVDHLGGTIEVTSRLGHGTTFTLAIPAELVDSSVHESVPSASTGRVLIVDDRNDALDALSSVVDELGFECDRASSAAVSANLLASRAYDLVLLDIEIPIKGGAKLAIETREGNGPNRATRFIGMSAVEVPDAIRRVFDACLTKPIDHRALKRLLLGPGPGSRPSQPDLWADT